MDDFFDANYRITDFRTENGKIVDLEINNKHIDLPNYDENKTVEVTENDATTVLTPVYEGGTVPSKVTNFCYYMMLDDEKVRVKFERTSYMPKINADITVKIQTTKGYKGNFKKISMSTWRNSNSPLICMALPNPWFNELKLFDMSKVEPAVLHYYK